MTAAAADVFDVAMQGLEAGFKVLHIATLDLVTCSVSDDADRILKDPGLIAFDYIPVQKDSRIVGVLDRLAEPVSGAVSGRMRQIDPSCLISADAPLRSFIPLVGERPYWLVVRVAGIKGIVTRSDLLKLPMRLHAFTIVTHLETLLADVIRAYCGSDDWVELLSEGRRQRLLDKQLELQRRKLDPPVLELTDFCDKRVVVAKVLGLRKEFTGPLEQIEKLRNSVAHASTFVNNDGEVQKFVERILAAEVWIDKLREFAANAGSSRVL
jgi:hypothetical protein